MSDPAPAPGFPHPPYRLPVEVTPRLRPAGTSLPARLRKRRTALAVAVAKAERGTAGPHTGGDPRLN